MKRVQRRGNRFIGQIRFLFWWIDVKVFTSSPDAVKWLGYEEEE